MVSLFEQDFTLQSIVFGSTIEQYLLYAASMIGFLLLGRIIEYALTTYGKHLAFKTKSDWDDLLIDAIALPIRYGTFIIGLTFSAEVFLTFPGEGVQSFYHNVVGLIGLGLVVYILIKIIDLFSERFLFELTAKTKSKLDDQLVPLVKRALKYVVIGMALLLALDNFGYDITALLAGLGIGGLAIAFAAQETVKDIFGGLVIFSNKTFFVGDRITIDNYTGTVEAINLRTTLIRNWEGRVLTFPNSKVASSVVENWARAKARRTFITLQLTYDTTSIKMDKAKEIVRKIINNTDGVLHDTPEKEEVLVWFAGFGAHSLDVNVIYFVQDQDDLLKIWDYVNSSIKREFEKAGIDFAYPTQTVYVKKTK
ncbi:MAG: mechanosensitive ion channel family protein [Candidatus Diapherotrites archaeon]